MFLFLSCKVPASDYVTKCLFFLVSIVSFYFNWLAFAHFSRSTQTNRCKFLVNIWLLLILFRSKNTFLNVYPCSKPVIPLVQIRNKMKTFNTIIFCKFKNETKVNVLVLAFVDILSFLPEILSETAPGLHLKRLFVWNCAMFYERKFCENIILFDIWIVQCFMSPSFAMQLFYLMMFYEHKFCHQIIGGS